MKIQRAVVVVLAASLLACATPPPPPPAPSAPVAESPDQLIAAAKALDAQFIDAFNRADLDGLLACYAADADTTLFPPGAMDARGPEGIRAAFAQALAAMAGGKLELVDPDYTVLGEAVLATGHWRFTTPASGTTPASEMQGRFTQVAVRRDGKMVYIHDHASVPMPPPPSGG